MKKNYQKRKVETIYTAFLMVLILFLVNKEIIENIENNNIKILQPSTNSNNYQCIYSNVTILLCCNFYIFSFTPFGAFFTN